MRKKRLKKFIEAFWWRRCRGYNDEESKMEAEGKHDENYRKKYKKGGEREIKLQNTPQTRSKCM